MNPALEERKLQLADKYIQDSEQREVFLTKATQYKMWANYIAGLILSNEGYKEFHLTDTSVETPVGSPIQWTWSKGIGAVDTRHGGNIKLAFWISLFAES